MSNKNVHVEACEYLGYHKAAQQVQTIFDELAEATRILATQNEQSMHVNNKAIHKPRLK